MNRRLLSLGLLALLAVLGAPSAQAATGPYFTVKALWGDTNLKPGDNNPSTAEGQFVIQARNVGDADPSGPLTIADQLPPGVTITAIDWTDWYSWSDFPHFDFATLAPTYCSGVGTGAFSCTVPAAEAIRMGARAPGVAYPPTGLHLAPTPTGYIAPIYVDVSVDPGASVTAANAATVTRPATVATLSDGGGGSNEVQSAAVNAGAGQFRLTPATAGGAGTLTKDSNVVTGVSTGFGAFHVGDTITGAHPFTHAGIPSSFGIGDLTLGSPTVVNLATLDSGTLNGGSSFAVGQTIAGPGIPAGTTITACSPSCGKGATGLTLSQNATATKAGAFLIANTTISAVGAGTLTLSSNANASGPQTLTATETTAPLAYNADPNSGAGNVQAALAALPGIGAGNVAVSGGPGDATGSAPYLVTFTGALAGTDLPQITAADGPAPLSGGAPNSTDTDPVPFNATPSAFGLVPGSYEADFFDAAYPFGSPARQAGDHPFEYRTNFDLNEKTGVFRCVGSGCVEDHTPGRYINPVGSLRDAEVTLPRGMIGNPEATPKCDPVDFASPGAVANSTGCPADTQVGYLNVWPAQYDGNAGAHGEAIGISLTRVAIYNLQPPKGTPADFAFNAGGYVQGHIYAALDPAQNYAIKTITPDISNIYLVKGSEVTFWGVPGDPAHDRFRYYPERQPSGTFNSDGFEIMLAAGAPWGSAPIRPLFSLPMDCGVNNGGSLIRVDSYADPGNLTPTEEAASPLNVSGCNDPRIRFGPEISLQPTDQHAGAPTGLDVHLQVPQRNDVVTDPTKLYAQNGDVQGIATPPMKKAVVTMPEGMTINPSAAQGLGSCTAAQLGLGTNDPVTCPDNSQYGTLTIHTPILPIDNQPEGFIYIAKQNDNPFNNFLSLYLVIQEPERGILVKIPGKLDLDPVSGQIVTSFDDLPQFPVSDMQMTLKGGVRAALVNPSTCGTKTIAADFYSWHDPNTPITVKNSYDVTQRPDGSPCVNSLGERPFGPQMSAGTINPTAGEYSPFVFRLTRSDDDQEFSQLGITLPPGLSAKIAGVGRCPAEGIAQAIARNGAGDGALEQANPSCPANSLIGTTDVGTGVGVPLTYVPGKVYLAGPYQGAPLSMVVITPAVVGPYDLGVIAVQSAARIDSKTAQVSIRTDPFPQIFQGIPVRIRDIRVRTDRPEFTFNPTSCEEMAVDAQLTGTGGDVNTTADDTTAELSERFQAAECASLGFKPKLLMRLRGGTKRGAHPALTATLIPRRGDANIRSVSVAFPKSEFLENAHIRTVCTRADFAASNCPRGAIYGKATAITPILDDPLEANIYLRSSSNLLPDVVPDFRGPPSLPVRIESAGRVDSINGGIRNTFDFIPDAPITRVTFALQGGKKGLLVNSRDICANTYRATVKYTAHNGATYTQRPKMVANCKKKGKKNKAKRRGHRRTR